MKILTEIHLAITILILICYWIGQKWASRNKRRKRPPGA